eukprot:6510668-Prymnesium_polylepis.1
MCAIRLDGTAVDEGARLARSVWLRTRNVLALEPAQSGARHPRAMLEHGLLRAHSVSEYTRQEYCMRHVCRRFARVYYIPGCRHKHVHEHARPRTSAPRTTAVARHHMPTLRRHIAACLDVMPCQQQVPAGVVDMMPRDGEQHQRVSLQHGAHTRLPRPAEVK